MGKSQFEAAILVLREQFPQLDWTYHETFPIESHSEKMFRWPGPAEDEILVVAHQSKGKQELFHRHDFFYFN